MQESDRYRTRQCVFCGVLELPNMRCLDEPFYCVRCESLGRVGQISPHWRDHHDLYRLRLGGRDRSSG
jgi:hypothetical protein